MQLKKFCATFVAVDVETASALPGAICQLGLAFFRAGQIVGQRSWLLRPGCAFDPRASRLHGLTAADVRDAPSWKTLYPEVARELHGNLIVSHTAFDRKQIFAACCRAGSTMFSYQRWFDTCALARDTWPGLPRYSLAALTERFNIQYRCHDAAEDARAAGELYLLALASRHETSRNGKTNFA